ncbi:MAG TPA: chemotaxis protein CheA [Acidimicrobiales bacterium]|nr:chemotaxis protein CheA [Acidimicrobiales bacterium]
MADSDIDDGTAEIIAEFLVEAYESLDQLDRDLVELERDPTDQVRLQSVFRTLHTIKGNGGFLGFQSLQSVAHAAESLLARLRDGELVLDPEITSGLLCAIDAIREMLAAIEGSGSEGTRHDQELVALLATLTSGAPSTTRSAQPGHSDQPPAPAGAAPPVPPRMDTVPPGDATGAEGAPDIADSDAASPATEPTSKAASTSAKLPAGRRRSTKPTKPQLPAPAVDAPSQDQAENDCPAATSTETVPASTQAPQRTAQASESPAAPSADGSSATAVASPHSEGARPVAGPATPAAPKALSPAATDAGEVRGAVAEQSVRVDVTVLDRLVNLVGELVLARNQIVQRARGTQDADLVATAQRLDLITSELQDGVMKTRMQPISTIWSRFPRVVRDLAMTCDKNVRLDMEGTETELDRTILEAIRDPMLHLVRNSVDHGIESPADRTAAGKAPEGRILLRAYHEGGYVNIEISDDGRGIDVERVRAKAISGEQDPERLAQLRAMSEREVINLVFSPGLSTAVKVTSVSGRGVGLDVVKTHVERIGGTIEVTTASGTGTTFKVRLPLTLAIVPALVVGCGSQRYCIPQGCVVELVRLKGSKAGSSVEQVAGANVYRLRGQLLPLVDLGTVLGRGGSSIGDGPVTVVVLQVDTRRFGLVVTNVVETQEIVVKPLDKALATVRVFSGATIMGDGGVALILEIAAVAARAGIFAGEEAATEATLAEDSATRTERHRLLVLGAGSGHRVAVSLDEVSRLERISSSVVEHSQRGEVVQYRGQTLSLLSLSDVFGGGYGAGYGEEARSDLPVVVTQIAGRPVGLVASEIVDIVDEDIEVERAAGHGGVVGTAIVAGQVTDLVDIHELIESLAPELALAPEGLRALAPTA